MKRLTQFVDMLSKAGLGPVDIFWMKQTARSGFVEHNYRLTKLLRRFFLVGLGTDVLDNGAQVGAIRAVSHAGVLRSAHALGARLMIRQWKPFPQTVMQ